MALFDKLKGIADKAKDVAKDVAQTAKMTADCVKRDYSKSPEAVAAREEAAAARAAEEAAKKDKRIEELKEKLLEYYDSSPLLYDSYLREFALLTSEEEAEAYEAQILDILFEKKKAAEQATLTELQAMLSSLTDTTNCDKNQGDCFWLGEKFYCTCGENVDCPKKKYVKKDQTGKLHAPEHAPYIKYLAQFERKKRYYDENEIYYLNKGTGTLEYADALTAFVTAFLPEHVGGIDADFSYAHGLGDENPIMRILYYVHDQTNGEVVPSIMRLTELYESGVDLNQSFFNNISLYKRNLNDFEYTAKVLDAASNPMKAIEVFGCSDKVNVDDLFNADGTIKAAGYGGPKAGFYGDEIYNIVSTWTEEE